MFASLVSALVGSQIAPTGFMTVLTPEAMAPTVPFWSDKEVVIERELNAPMRWDDAVLSWTGRADKGAIIRVEVSAQRDDRWTKFYSLGEWSEDANRRRSVNDQKDADGTVYTDTLSLSAPSRRLRLRLTLVPGIDRTMPQVERVDFSFILSGFDRPDEAPLKSVWGKQLKVSKRNQGEYANGGVLCSPTSVSMQLKYWADASSTPSLDLDVPLVQAGVYDEVWGGTGNWSFNAAFAARQGLRSYVTRLNNLTELERWIAAGIPLATSVSYDLLKGKDKRGENDGHLVVVIGLTSEGDLVFNDPGRSVPSPIIYKRADFLRAWTTSGRTVYVIHPYGHSVPQKSGAPWDQRPEAVSVRL